MRLRGLLQGHHLEERCKGRPTVGGAITQAATVSTFTGSGTVTATTAVTGFQSPGLIQVHTTSGTAWLTYTGTSSDSFTGVSDDSGTGSVTTGTIVESGPGSNGYTGYTTYGGAALTVTHTATSLATVTTQTATRPVTTLPTVTVTNLATASSTSTSLTGGNLPVASTTAEPFTTSGTLQVTTSTGVATLSYTGISGNTFTGVKYVSGAKGHIYKGAIRGGAHGHLHGAPPRSTAPRGNRVDMVDHSHRRHQRAHRLERQLL